MDYRSRLKEMQSTVKKQMANYTPGGFAAIPDNTYECIVKAVMDHTKKDPVRMMISWCFIVNDGDYIGRQVWDRTIVEDNEVGLNICRSRIEALGFEWPEDDLPTLVDMVEMITEQQPVVTARITTKEKDGYTNTNIRIKDVVKGIEIDESAVTSNAEEQVEQEQAQEQEAEDTPADEDPGTQQKQELLDFCAAQGIEGITEDLEVSDIINALRDNKFTFAQDTLSESEIELLNTLDASDLIEVPAPKVTKALTKPALKAAAKPTAKSSVKKR